MKRQNYFRTFPQVIVPKDVSVMKLTEERWRILLLRYLMYLELGNNFTRQEICEKYAMFRIVLYFLICTISRPLMDDCTA